MANKFRVLLVYPCRDVDSQVRTQFSQEQVHGLLVWPFRLRSFGLAFNGLETLAALTPDWVDLTVANENLDTIDFDGAYDLVALTVMVTNATRACQIETPAPARIAMSTATADATPTLWRPTNFITR